MGTTITQHIPEKSTAIFTVTMDNENGDPIVNPDSFKWSLTNEKGKIINGRKEVVGTPDGNGQVTIVLANDDTAVSSGFQGESELRVLLVECIYDAAVQNNTPDNDEAYFYIDRLKGMPKTE